MSCLVRQTPGVNKGHDMLTSFLQSFNPSDWNIYIPIDSPSKPQSKIIYGYGQKLKAWIKHQNPHPIHTSRSGNGKSSSQWTLWVCSFACAFSQALRRQRTRLAAQAATATAAPRAVPRPTSGVHGNPGDSWGPSRSGRPMVSSFRQR